MPTAAASTTGAFRASAENAGHTRRIHETAAPPRSSCSRSSSWSPAGSAPSRPARAGGTGQWTSPTGFLYLAEVRLEIRADGAAEGAITWTLAHSPRESELPKLGQKGVEYVRGRYDGASRVLALEGYRKEDPLDIIGLDTYRLLLAENRRSPG